MKKKLVALAAWAVAVVSFLNILTGTWLNLVNLHVLPSVYTGSLNGTVIVALVLSAAIALLLSVGAFFLGGLYWFVALGVFIVNRLDPSLKGSPARVMWILLVDTLVQFFQRRKKTTHSSNTVQQEEKPLTASQN